MPEQAQPICGGLDVREVNQANPPRLIDAVEAAKLLGVPKSWVLAEARADRIPHVRLGRYVRFEAVDLTAWWRARSRGPRPAPARRTGLQPVSDRREAA